VVDPKNLGHLKKSLDKIEIETFHSYLAIKQTIKSDFGATKPRKKREKTAFINSTSDKCGSFSKLANRNTLTQEANDSQSSEDDSENLITRDNAIQPIVGRFSLVPLTEAEQAEKAVVEHSIRSFKTRFLRESKSDLRYRFILGNTNLTPVNPSIFGNKLFY
jgi:hypothetical protein